MRTIASAAVAASIVLAATAGHASETDTVKQTVRTWFAKFNGGDAAGALAMCADEGSIIDEFAPFRWTSFSDWFKAYDVYATQNGITGSRVNFTRFVHVNVKDGRAYVTGPATYTYRENGKARVESAMDVITLEKTVTGWRITSAAWFGRNGADTGGDATAVTNAVSSFASMAIPPAPRPVAIVDEFPPYRWDGANADADWRAGLAKLMAADDETNMAIGLGKPSQLSVNADRAYAAYPTVITSKHHGKSFRERGDFAFTLEKGNDAWHVVSWAWATK